MASRHKGFGRKAPRPIEFYQENSDMNRSRLCVVLLLLSVGLTFSNVGLVFAQSTSGTILGRITDPQDAAGAQATVTAKNDDTGLSQSTETNENGDFTLANLPPGNYTVTVTKSGFSTTASQANK